MGYVGKSDKLEEKEKKKTKTEVKMFTLKCTVQYIHTVTTFFCIEPIMTNAARWTDENSKLE